MREKFTIAKLLIALKNRNECQMLSLNSSEQADLIPEIEKLLSELEKLQQENYELTKSVHNKVNSVISGEQNKALEQIHLRLVQKYNSNQYLSLDRKEVGEIADQIKRLFKENELLLLQNDVLKNENNTLNQECARRIVENEKYKKENERLKTDNKTANTNYNTWADNAKKEIAGLKEKHSTLFNDREVEKDNYTLMYNKLSRDYEKLKSENEELTEWNDILVKNLSKIPNVITKIGGEHAFCYATFDTFIKNALAKELEREKWYVVKCSEFDNPMPAYIDSDGNWFCDGYRFDDNDINVLNTTPIDLGEKV